MPQKSINRKSVHNSNEKLVNHVKSLLSNIFLLPNHRCNLITAFFFFPFCYLLVVRSFEVIYQENNSLEISQNRIVAAFRDNSTYVNICYLTSSGWRLIKYWCFRAEICDLFYLTFYFSFASNATLRGLRIRSLYPRQRVRHPAPQKWHEISSDGEAPLLKIWGVLSTDSLPLLPIPLIWSSSTR